MQIIIKYDNKLFNILFLHKTTFLTSLVKVFSIIIMNIKKEFTLSFFSR